MGTARLRLVTPKAVNGTVRPPRRRKNAELRTREYLTEAEVDRLIAAAKQNRHGRRDATMILLAFRHGLRAAEVVDLRWDQVELKAGRLHVRRVKSGTPSVHPLSGEEIRGLRKLQREAPASPFVFVSERAAPFTTAGFGKMIARSGVAAKFNFGVHPHMLRHACGFALAKGARHAGAAALPRAQEYPTHGSLQRTVADKVQGLLENLARLTIPSLTNIDWTDCGARVQTSIRCSAIRFNRS
jgi:integrase